METPARSFPATRLLKRQEAAAYAGVSVTLFNRMIADGIMPGPKRVYGLVRWDLFAVNEAIDRLPSEGVSNENAGEPNDWDEVLR